MKKHLLLISCIVLVLQSQAQTPAIYSTLPNGGTARDLIFKGPDTSFCINSYWLYRSTDDLKTWQNSVELQFGGAYTFTSMDGFGEKIMAGQNTGGRYILSNDAGATWSDVKFIGKNQQVNDIEFLNSTTVFALASSGSSTDSIILFKSTDGAETWERVYKFPKRGANARMTFLNASIGAVYFNSNLYITKDAGLNWYSPSGIDTTENVLSVYLYDAQNAFVGQDAGGLYKSTDGMQTFNFTQSVFPRLDYENQLLFSDLSTGYVTEGYTRDFAFRKTTDGGVNWTTLATGVNFKNFHIVDDNTVYLYGANNNFYKVSTVLSGINTNEISSNIKIYPNPSTGLVTIKSTENIKDKTLRVYSSLGKLIQEQHIGINDFQINLVDAGIYILMIDHQVVGRVNIQ